MLQLCIRSLCASPGPGPKWAVRASHPVRKAGPQGQAAGSGPLRNVGGEFTGALLERVAGADESGLIRQHDELGAVAGVEFHHRPVEMGLDGERREKGAFGDVVV